MKTLIALLSLVGLTVFSQPIQRNDFTTNQAGYSVISQQVGALGTNMTNYVLSVTNIVGQSNQWVAIPGGIASSNGNVTVGHNLIVGSNITINGFITLDNYTKIGVDKIYGNLSLVSKSVGFAERYMHLGSGPIYSGLGLGVNNITFGPNSTNSFDVDAIISRDSPGTIRIATNLTVQGVITGDGSGLTNLSGGGGSQWQTVTGGIAYTNGNVTVASNVSAGLFVGPLYVGYTGSTPQGFYYIPNFDTGIGVSGILYGGKVKASDRFSSPRFSIATYNDNYTANIAGSDLSEIAYYTRVSLWLNPTVGYDGGDTKNGGDIFANLGAGGSGSTVAGNGGSMIVLLKAGGTPTVSGTNGNDSGFNIVNSTGASVFMVTNNGTTTTSNLVVTGTLSITNATGTPANPLVVDDWIPFTRNGTNGFIPWYKQ